MVNDKELLMALHGWIGETMQHSMHDSVHYLKEKELSLSQCSTLFRIHCSEIHTVTDISEDLGISNAAASQMLDRMVQQGLIARIENPEDRRSKQLSLTDKGTSIVKETLNVRDAWMKELVNTMTPREKEMTTETFTMLAQKTKSITGVSHAFMFV